jgi:hypothetical protein
MEGVFLQESTVMGREIMTTQIRTTRKTESVVAARDEKKSGAGTILVTNSVCTSSQPSVRQTVTISRPENSK